MIHFALAIFALATTCLALTVASYLSPIADADPLWASGSVAAVLTSGVLVLLSWR